MVAWKSEACIDEGVLRFVDGLEREGIEIRIVIGIDACARGGGVGAGGQRRRGRRRWRRRRKAVHQGRVHGGGVALRMRCSRWELVLGLHAAELATAVGVAIP